MRVAVLSDIHSNLAALEAVLEDLGAVDAIWVLGDIVGYGPDPDAVVARLRDLDVVAVRGNHDAAALGQLDASAFNDDARNAVIWTGRTMAEATRAWLDALPKKREVEGYTLAHGSPRDPLWEYVLSPAVAERNLDAFETTHCLVGHTHVPLVFRQDEDEMETIWVADGSTLELDARRTICNPGGVGQPRDGDPRACAMLLDTESATLEWRRIPYPIEQTQERMRKERLPARLVNRLAHGV